MSPGPTSSDCCCDFSRKMTRGAYSTWDLHVKLPPHVVNEHDSFSESVHGSRLSRSIDDGSTAWPFHYCIWWHTVAGGEWCFNPLERKEGKGNKGDETEEENGRGSLSGTTYATWAPGNVWLLVVIAIMKQGAGWEWSVHFRFYSPVWPREPLQMSPEIQEIEWIVCDCEGGRAGGREGGDWRKPDEGYFG